MILNSCTNGESRTSYRESIRGTSLSGQKTKDAPTTDFSIILQRPTAVTQHGMIIHVFTQATVCSKLEQFKLESECFSRTSVSRFFYSSKVSNAYSKCKQTVYMYTRVQATAFLSCNVKRF